ncbi:hypothetical protein DBR39_02745 [Chryseobacterium sp. KBW03]|nr:hypothetical protein DBR39_02745 [Chryseobacterium sp. KBW03]
MIKFIRLLFYHIYIYYYKADNRNKALAKFTTFLIFTIIFVFLIVNLSNLVYQYYDNNYTTLSGNSYILVSITIGLIIGYYLYKDGFHDFNKYNDYDKKYYYYFFIIMTLILCLVIYTGKTSRERIFKQKALDKENTEKIQVN